MKKYFNETDIENFKNYATATSADQKNKIYNKYLYSFIDKQIDTILKLNNWGTSNIITNNYEDIKQELHINILLKVLPNIDINKINAIQNYLYLSIRNALVNIIKYNSAKNKIVYDKNYNINTEENNNIIDEEDYTDDIINKINVQLDSKILACTEANSVNAIYLQVLKNYILFNNYDATGFSNYCMEIMKINKSHFLNLSHLNGFRTIAFKEKK